MFLSLHDKVGDGGSYCFTNFNVEHGDVINQNWRIREENHQNGE
jgi:hypothetical protein